MADSAALESTRILGTAVEAIQVERPILPAQTIGRYRLCRLLGQGGFGAVYLARDEQLDRLVAVKVAHRRFVSRPGEADEFIQEARTVAGLDHPHIVPVFDVGEVSAGVCYIVTKYIEGESLRQRLSRAPLSAGSAIEIAAALADALHYAHVRGIVHRDVKPANILLDPADRPYLVDFGLALKEHDPEKSDLFAGTPRYMSPEQVRGEGHRVDGRSDIFSLGIVLYQMLTGRHPFIGPAESESLSRIAGAEPRPLRQIDDRLPKEVERICLKCLSQKVSDRYTTARDLGEDLQQVLSENPRLTSPGRPTSLVPGSPLLPPDASADTPVSATPLSRITSVVPKGLRAFDEQDAYFFLGLVPGPRDREGLPESLRFWKARIENADRDEAFTVGLIYGPSGCGKSSLVRAGLLPLLSDEILPVYIESTGAETESALLGRLRRACPALPATASLPAALALLRKDAAVRPRRKILLVLDQFEQWLHAPRTQRDPELAAALRQCDGDHVQCLLLVRDDFWLGISRFMQDLEIRLVEGQNSMFVDLFDQHHARSVLAAFGRAYGRLPDAAGDLSPAQQRFLDAAVRDLSQDGKVTCVQLALLADMLRSKPWTVATLQSLGGISGIGQLFLQESFDASTAPAKNRHHARAARAVLSLLLPESGADLKGNMRSWAELFEASQYSRESGKFEELIQLLDQELRLMTPAETLPDAEPPAGPHEHPPSYHLAHDYLVPSLRDWLTRKRRETRSGRALLKLEEHTALWQSRPQPRLLPGFRDFLAIRLLTNSRSWTPPQTRLMRAARRRYGQRFLAGVTVVALLLLAAGAISRELRSAAERRQAEQFVSRLWQAEWEYVPALLEESEHLRRQWEPLLARAGPTSLSPDQRLRKSVALAGETLPDLAAVCQQLLKLPREALPVLLPSLARHHHRVSEYLWTEIDAAELSPLEQLSRGAILTAFAAGDRRWSALSPAIVEQLLRTDPLELEGWVRLLRPAASHLIPDLLAGFDHADPGRRQVAASLLVRFGALDGVLLPADRVADVIVTADAQQWRVVIARIKAVADAGALIPLLEQVLNETGSPAEVTPGQSEGLEQAAFLARLKRRTNAAAALLHLGQPDAFWGNLAQSSEPDLRTALIAAAAALDVPWRALLDQAESASPASIRQAAVLSLDAYRAACDDRERAEIGKRLEELFLRDADAGVHAACGWLLARMFPEFADWRHEAAAADVEAGWFVSPMNHLLVRIPAPGAFQIGSPETEIGRDSREYQLQVHIDYDFALSACEISSRQFREFEPDFAFAETVSPTSEDGPATNVSFFDALRYCRWLSEREGISPDEMCYPPVTEIGPGMVLEDDYHLKGGYRLPLEGEWEYAVRAGSVTDRFFVRSPDLLDRYAWWAFNSREQTHPVAVLCPNPFGLFDVYGNVSEWTHALPQRNLMDEAVARGGDYRSTPRFLRAAMLRMYQPEARLSTLGFRIARTLKSAPDSPTRSK